MPTPRSDEDEALVFRALHGWTRLLTCALMLLFHSGAGTAQGTDTSSMVSLEESQAATDGTVDLSNPPPVSPSTEKPSDKASGDTEIEEPWDYSPYRVMVWVVSDHPWVNADLLREPLQDFLDRDFAALWRLSIDDAPETIGQIAKRDLANLDYDGLTASDPVFAVKRDHPEAIRIRVASNVGEFAKEVHGTSARIADLRRRATDAGDATIAGVDQRLVAIESQADVYHEQWAKPETEALLVPRAIALALTEPEAKLIKPPLDDLVSETIDEFDKVFIVRIRSGKSLGISPGQVDVVEMDTLMRFFSPVVHHTFSTMEVLIESVGNAVIESFAPVVRVDDAGQKTASGLLRAAGLAIDPQSPALLRENDLLLPMVRKNDRNGDPFLIGEMDWAYLLVTEIEDRTIKTDYYAGRSGSLQGRKNKRTYRQALKVRPGRESTMLRLHAQGDVDFPLIGYEIYERELDSKTMTFVGRTDWNGKLPVDKTEDPLRLLYVKNGGAVLARLPMVPGYLNDAVADLQGDDLRLQAEAYIRSVQIAIIDLVAVRELYKARIRLRLTKGQMKEAEKLMEALRNQPSNEKLAGELGKKQAVFLKLLGNGGGSQRRKVDDMFSTTREMLGKHINPRLVNDLENDLIAARKNGGKLPVEKEPK